MAKAFGIIVDGEKAYAAHVKGSARRVRVLGFHEERIGAGPDAGQNLGKLLARIGAKRNVFFALEGRTAFVRRVTLPLRNPRQIAQTARFQVESLSPAVPLEQLSVGYHVAGRNESSSEVVLFAVEKARIQSLRTLSREAGVEPAGVTLDLAALFNLARVEGGLGDGSAAVVDLCDGTARVVLAREGELVLSRTIALASGSDAADRVVEEMRKSLVVSGIGESLDRIAVTGAAAPVLSAALGRAFGVEARVLDPLAGLPGPDGSAAPGQAVYAVGAALAGLGAERIALDFLKDGAGPARGFGALREKILYAVSAACVLFLILAVKSWQEADREEEELGKMTAKARTLYREVQKPLGLRKGFRLQSYDRVIEAAIKKAGKNTETQETQYASFLSTWKRIAQALDGGGATVVNIVFDQQKTVVTGVIPDIEQFDKLERSFRGVFGERIQSKFERRGKRGRRRAMFTIEIPTT
jgi:hypothetical protein